MIQPDIATKYYILKWKDGELHSGWQRLEIRPMPVERDNRYDVLEINLSFTDANTRKKNMEEIEKTRTGEQSDN